MKNILCLMGCLFLFVVMAKAQNQGTGIGVIAGEPTGISVKFWQDRNIAIDGGAAWSLGKNATFHFHGDYLFHSFKVFTNPAFVFYYGPGLRLRMGTEDHLGVRLALGIAYFFKYIPLDAFLEMVPIFDLIPATRLSFNAGIGVRFFFK